MPRKTDRPTKEDLIKAEEEIGKNIPEELVGMDDGDVRPEEKGDEPEPRH